MKKLNNKRIINDGDFGEIILDHLIERVKQYSFVLKNLPVIFKRLNIAKSLAVKFVAIVLIIGIQGAGLFTIGYTVAYYSDTEGSTGNEFKAAFLDFYLTHNDFNTFIGKEALGEYAVASVVMEEPGSLDVQYFITTEKISGDDSFCNGLDLEATKNGIEVHDDSVLLFSDATTTDFGVWEFEFDLPPSVTDIGHGDICDLDIVFSGWREDVVNPEDSGFDDEERINFSFVSKMVVMNEMIPDPSGSDSQDGLAGEWVEIYNNGDTAVDLEGWVISELSDPQGTPSENLYTVVATSSPGVGEVRTASGSTVIGAGGFLVIVFDAARLNNTGDTVTLYDASSNQMDQHTYLADEAPEGKSIARIPDGIGIWIDPIPTPGGINIDGEIPIVQTSTGVTDITPPTIVINGNNPTMLEMGSTYVDLGASVTDNVNNNLGIVVNGDEVDTSVPETYFVSYTATDQAGNSSMAEREVIVYDPALGIPEVETIDPVQVNFVEVVEEPVVEEPQNLIEELIIEIEEIFEPVIEEVIVEEPVVEEVVIEEPVVEEEPIIEEVVEEEPVIEIIIETEVATSTEEVILEEVMIEEPVSEEPIDEVIVEVVEEVVIEEEVVEDPIVEEPVVDEPIAELIAVIVEEPALIEDPVIIPEGEESQEPIVE